MTPITPTNRLKEYFEEQGQPVPQEQVSTQKQMAPQQQYDLRRRVFWIGFLAVVGSVLAALVITSKSGRHPKAPLAREPAGEMAPQLRALGGP